MQGRAGGRSGLRVVEVHENHLDLSRREEDVQRLFDIGAEFRREEFTELFAVETRLCRCQLPGAAKDCLEQESPLFHVCYRRAPCRAA